jgi:ATP-dependent DNA helicase DinG
VVVEKSRLSIEDVFARLADKFDSYEHRLQQVELAQRIQQTFNRKDTGIFEAGTGTGKSLAALIPAALSGKKVVVSSATIALQEQYIHKDIPLLQSILPFDIDAQVMKGRSNYIGLRRWKEFQLEQELDDRLVDWVNSTTTGDLSELDFTPPADIWNEVDSDSDDCLRNKCPEFNQCFYFEARRRAEKADVLIVNHALLLADAASMGNIIPQYDLLIVDEAQHLPEIARDAFSSAISVRGLRMLASKALKKVNAPPGLVQQMEMESDHFFSRLNIRFPAMKTRLREPVVEGQGLRLSLLALKNWLSEQQFEHILDVEMARERAKLKAKALLTTTSSYINCLELLENPSKDWVVWTERGDAAGSRFEVVAAPLDVSPFLQQLVFDKQGLEASVWMSATLATGGPDPFAYFKREVGAPDLALQSRVSSPFDYKRQALLYLPNHLPEPNHPDYIWESSREIERLVRLSDGRAFVLFTSYNALNRSFDILKDVLPFECKKQGDLPRKRLIDWFRSTPSAVLFGTSSFWEGVSIDGDQLSCVIIDRIPFQVPGDPVYEARCEALKDGEGDWFQQLALPHAIMRLKQGVGRLIRTKSDRGIVSILDPRISRKQYGRLIVECLPPMRVIRSLNGIDSIDEKLDAI